MTIRSKGPGAGFGWLLRGIGATFRHPRPLLGAAALLMLAGLLPSVVTLPLQVPALQPQGGLGAAQLIAIMVVSSLAGLALMPLYAGFLQVIDAAERGLPARARDIVAPYRRGGAMRIIGYGIVMLLAYLAVFALLVIGTGSPIVHWYVEALANQAAHLPPPTLPSGSGLFFALAVVIGLFMFGFYAISLGQLALGRRSVGGALIDGLAGGLKNVLPLAVFALCLIPLALVLLVGMVIIAIPLALIGKLLGAWLFLILAVPLYIAFALMTFSSMFSVIYHVWRDVCGDGDVDTTDAFELPPHALP